MDRREPEVRFIGIDGGSQRTRLGLTGRVLVLQFVVSVVAIGVGLAWLGWSTGSSVPTRRADSADLAARLAGSPALRADLARFDPTALEALASGARRAAGAEVVVVETTDGRSVVSGDGARRPGTGRVARDAPAGGSPVGRAPVTAADGRRLGQVVVALPPGWGHQGDLGAAAAAKAALIALGVGLVGSVLLARWLRRRTFGLELDELTDLLQEQQATLFGIREGVVGLDGEGRIRFVNDEGRRLLGLPHRCLRRPLRVLLPPGRLRDIVEGKLAGEDLVVVHGDRVLVVTHIPVEVEDHRLGSVVTVADRTESESLLRELDGTLGLTEALRAQAHDFANRMHTLVGLVELGEYQEAVDFGTRLQSPESALTPASGHPVGDPVVAALLLAKGAVARERQVELATGPGTRLAGRVAEPSDVVTVLGNVVDNAIDAACGHDPARVEVTSRSCGPDLEIVVVDSGPGVPPEDLQRVFVDGYTTKASATGLGRGLGLAIVHQIVARRRGTIEIGRDPGLGGARFVIHLPGVIVPVEAGPGPGAEGSRCPDRTCPDPPDDPGAPRLQPARAVAAPLAAGGGSQ